MRNGSSDAARFTAALFLKGALMLLGGGIALLWPNETLVLAMMFAGSLLALVAVYEILLAFHARHDTRGWMLALADGALALGLAVLTITITAVPLRTTMLLGAVWLGASAAIAGILALALWPMPRTRAVLGAWAAVNVALAAMALVYDADIFILLYVGAGYAIAYGVFHLLAAAWMRRFGAPELSPPLQAAWGSPSSVRPIARRR